MTNRGRLLNGLALLALATGLLTACQNQAEVLPEPEPISNESLEDYVTAHPAEPTYDDDPCDLDKYSPMDVLGDCLPPVGAFAAGELLTTAHLDQANAAPFFAVEPISDEVFARMDGRSWREGAIPISELRYLRLLYWLPDADLLPAYLEGSTTVPGTHVGEIVVNEAIASDVLEIFAELYDAEYPVALMVLIDSFDANDTLSMNANNTSGFNHRLIAGTSTLSNHARGMAIDLNPVQNPWVSGGSVEPVIGAPYADRSDVRPLMITHDDLAYRLFKQHGFSWGGDWRSPRDYQHFEKS